VFGTACELPAVAISAQPDLYRVAIEPEGNNVRIKMWGLAAAVAVVLAGCGSSASSSPVSSAKQWYAALATRNAQKICDLSTEARKAAMISITAQISGGTQSCAVAADRLLGLIRAEKLAEFARARPQLIKQSGNRAEVAKGPGGGWVRLERSGARWLIASTSEESG
jgi:hypothetical protein